MGFQIQDGKGTGFLAGVDNTNRLQTRTINEGIFQNSSRNGNSFFLGTPLVTLTTATASAIIYVENNEDQDLMIEEIFFISEASTGGVGNMFRTAWYKNPTDILGTLTTPLNQNFGSSAELNATIKYGAQGAGVSGGTLVSALSFPLQQFNILETNLVLPKGTSFAITVQPPASNTSMPIQIGAKTYKITVS